MKTPFLSKKLLLFLLGITALGQGRQSRAIELSKDTRSGLLAAAFPAIYAGCIYGMREWCIFMGQPRRILFCSKDLLKPMLAGTTLFLSIIVGVLPSFSVSFPKCFTAGIGTTTLLYLGHYLAEQMILRKEHNNPTALQEALFCRDTELFKLLLAEGKDPNIVLIATGHDGPILHANIISDRGEFERTKALLAHGANINSRNPNRNNETPLIAAARVEAKNTMRLLLLMGADTTIRNNNNQSVRDVLVANIAPQGIIQLFDISRQELFTRMKKYEQEEFTTIMRKRFIHTKAKEDAVTLHEVCGDSNPLRQWYRKNSKSELGFYLSLYEDPMLNDKSKLVTYLLKRKQVANHLHKKLGERGLATKIMHGFNGDTTTARFHNAIKKAYTRNDNDLIAAIEQYGIQVKRL